MSPIGILMENKHGAQEQVIASQQGVFGRIYQWLCRPYLHTLLAAEISSFSRYFDRVVQLEPRADDNSNLLNLIDCRAKSAVKTVSELPQVSDLNDRTLVLLNGNLNHHFDVQQILQNTKARLSRNSRVCVVVYNSYLRGLYALANWLHIRSGELPSTFLTQRDINNLCDIAGFSIVRARPVGYFPMQFAGLGSLINLICRAIPVVRWLGFTEVILLKPLIPSRETPSLSIVIPTRNEKGNIENALKRLEQFGEKKTEVIFVEGHSNDGTWEEIQRVLPLYKEKFLLKAFRQTGKGKNDAVRLGFKEATGELLTILDADLTMPPELLGRFYDAYVEGKADFVNGSRLVYPMEGEAMRFLNWLGNVFFARALSWVLECSIGDSLCGTKFLSKRDYNRIVAWRNDFGDFDPFGDFELLFPAAILGLGVVDIPIRYRARTYGSTNIHRFRHGFQLLRMTLIGFFRIRMGLGAR